jgi:hypothetical protein
MRRFLLFFLCLAVCLLLSPAPTLSPHAPDPPPEPAGATNDPLPDAATMDRLAREQPLVFLEHCLRRCQQEVTGYRALLIKRERLGGTLHDEEQVDVAFREHPYSTLMRWRNGKRSVLYVEGENNGKLLVHPSFLGILRYNEVDPDNPLVRRESRYSIKESSIQDGMVRTLRDWTRVKNKGDPHIEYLGVLNVPEANNQSCYTLVRHCTHPEEDGFTEVRIDLDTATWLQVGSVMTGPEGLVGSYFFRDIELNPDFPKDQFTPAALTKKE